MRASLFDAFIEQSPLSVMMRALMEQVLRPQRLDAIFEAHAKRQYQRELLCSTLVNLLSLVVCGIQPSVNAAYKAQAFTVNRSAFTTSSMASNRRSLRRCGAKRHDDCDSG